MDLVIHGLSKRYPNGVQALKQVSLAIPAGMFGLLGPNGAGKTSTLSAIEGLLIPHSGTIRVAGYDIRKESLKVRVILPIARA